MNDLSPEHDLLDGSAAYTVVFGGTFDPPQEGHVDAVRQLLAKGHQLIVLAPTAQNPFKERQATSFELRREMLAKVFEYEKLPLVDSPSLADKPGSQAVYIADYPYERTYQWVDWWRTTHKGTPLANLTWAVGPDLLPELHTWAHWDTMKLPVVTLEERLPVHSTMVRKGQEPPHPALTDLIREHNLYSH